MPFKVTFYIALDCSHLALKFFYNRNTNRNTIFMMHKKIYWEIFVGKTIKNILLRNNHKRKKCESFTTGKLAFQFRKCNKVSYFRRYPKIVSLMLNYFAHTCRQISSIFGIFFTFQGLTYYPGNRTPDCIHMYDAQ